MQKHPKLSLPELIFCIAPGVWWGVGYWHILFTWPIALRHSLQTEMSFQTANNTRDTQLTDKDVSVASASSNNNCIIYYRDRE